MNEDAWSMGWSDGYHDNLNNNPFPIDTEKWIEYEEGYKQGSRDC